MEAILHCGEWIMAEHVCDFHISIGLTYHLYVKDDTYYYFPGGNEVVYLGEFPTKKQVLINLLGEIITDFIAVMDPETATFPGTTYTLQMLVEELRKTCLLRRKIPMKLLELQRSFIGLDVVKCFFSPWEVTYILYSDSDTYFIRECDHNRIYFLGKYSSKKQAVEDFIYYLKSICPDGFSSELNKKIMKKLT